MPFAENLGSGGSALDAQYGSSAAPNTNSPLLLDPRTSGNFVYTPGSAGNYVSVPHADSLNILGTEGTPFLSLPGSANNFAQTPTTAALNITGDIEIIVRVALDNWSAILQGFVAKFDGPTGSGRSYGFRTNSVTPNRLEFFWQDSGTATLRNVVANANFSFTNGTTYWIRVRFDADNGSGGNDAEFSFAADSPAVPTVWTPIGTTVTTATVAAIATGTFPLVVGSENTANRSMAGKVYRAIVIADPFGTPVIAFDANFIQEDLGSRGFIENTGKLVTLTGAAAQIVDGTTYGFLPGVAGAGWSTPDVAALDVTGDIDLRARISLNDWTPSAEQAIIGKWTAAGNQRSYALRLTSGGSFYLTNSPDGIAAVTTTANAANTLTNGQTYWIRATLDVDNGAGNRVANFYYAADSETEPTAWTSIGTAVTVAGTTSIFNSTSTLEIGSFNGGASPVAGRVFRAQVFNGIAGTKVFDADFTRQIQFAGSFTEATGKVVTTQGAARIERDRDLDVRVKVALDDWTPSNNMALIGKLAGQRSYLLMALSNGNLWFGWSPDGTTEISGQSTSATGFADGTAKWVRATLDVNNGSNGRTITFYTSDDGTTWTTLGSPVATVGAASIFPSTVPVEVGTYSSGTDGLTAAKFFAAQVRNGINGPAVLDLDFTQQITSGGQSVIEPVSGATIPQAVQFAPNLGTGGAALNARYGASVLPEPTTNDPLLLEHTGTNYLYLPGVQLSYASTPSAIGSVTDITGDIAIAVHVDRDIPINDATFVVKRELGVDSSLQSYNLSQFTVTGGLRVLRFNWVQSDGTFRDVIGAVEVDPSQFSHLGVTHDVDDGAGGNVVSFWTSTDGVNWSLVESRTNAYTTDHRSNAAQIGIGGTTVGVGGAAGKYYRARIWNAASFAGAPVFDADFTTGITSGAQTTFTESSSNAATVTINRSTSGRKSVAVVRDVWLFGTDDYLEVADNDLLDFGAGDDMTALVVMRQWSSTAGAFRANLAKMNSLNTTQGWAIYSTAADQNVAFRARSTATSVQPSSLNTTPGQVSILAGTRSGSLHSFYINGASTSTTATAQDTTNTVALRIGANVTGGQVWEGELLGAAVFRRALSASEIALVNTHYQTGPTAASNALLSESVWWIDAGRTAAAQINRSTTGRKSVACADCIWLLGTDDFFEVADNPLLDFDQGEDFTLMSLVRVWDFQGTNDSLIAKSSSNTAGAAGYGLATGGSDPLTTTARLGDGSTGASVSTLARVPSRLVAVWAWRDTPTGTLHISLNNAASTSTPDLTTGNSGNSLALRLGALSGTASEFLNGELKSTAIWRRTLTASERAAVNNYYGTI
jgi:hypothetical protein